MKHRKWFFLAPPLIVGVVFLFGWIVMQLWNYALVPALHVGALTFWQGLAILILSRILFGGFGKGGGWKQSNKHQQLRQKWSSMSEEERVQFKEAWKQRCVPKE